MSAYVICVCVAPERRFFFFFLMKRHLKKTDEKHPWIISQCDEATCSAESKKNNEILIH